MISILFILDYVVLDSGQQQQFSKFLAQWAVICHDANRQVVDAIIPDEYVDDAFALLSAFPIEIISGEDSIITHVDLHPSIIGKWHQDGSIIELNDTTEYIALLPPIITIDEIEIPRTEAVEIHKFSGWGERQWA